MAANGDDARVEEIRRSFAGLGFVLLGPINPGGDAETRARIGWIAPYGRAHLRLEVTGAGVGATACAAAEDALAQFETEFGSPPGTSE